MARSTLSSVIILENHCGVTFGKHPFVKRVLKEIFEAKQPVFPKYKLVWDVSKLFRFFRILEDPHSLIESVIPIFNKLKTN